jgi:hypothetical protein
MSDLHLVSERRYPIHRTPHGFYIQDPSGLWHYRLLSPAADARAAAQDAMYSRPEGACWFWWLGTFAPIHRDDKFTTLTQRWLEYREASQRRGTLEVLQAMYADSTVRVALAERDRRG